MKNNPVYWREMTIRARSFRMPLVILVFNAVLAAFSLLSMYSTVARVRISAQIQYSSFLQLYSFVATIEFLLLMFIMPSLTSAGISGERERGTLELLFTTKMTPADIVAGKLLSALNQLLLLIVSGFPILLLTFVYGSVGFYDLGLLLLCYVTTAFFCSGLGILFSALTRRSTVSNVCAYGVLLLIVAGTLLLNQFFYALSYMQIGEAAYSIGNAHMTADSGIFVWLLLLNPIVTFAEILGSQASDTLRIFTLNDFLGSRADSFIAAHWIAVSIFVQTAFSLISVWIAVRFVGPENRQKRIK